MFFIYPHSLGKHPFLLALRRGDVSRRFLRAKRPQRRRAWRNGCFRRLIPSSRFMILFVKPKTHHQETNFISRLKNHVINKPVPRPMTNANYSFAPFMRLKEMTKGSEINISILCFSLDEMFRSRLIEGPGSK